MSNTDADTCRKFVVRKLQAAGWGNESPPTIIADTRLLAKFDDDAGQLHIAAGATVQLRECGFGH